MSQDTSFQDTEALGIPEYHDLETMQNHLPAPPPEVLPATTFNNLIQKYFIYILATTIYLFVLGLLYQRLTHRQADWTEALWSSFKLIEDVFVALTGLAGV